MTIAVLCMNAYDVWIEERDEPMEVAQRASLTPYSDMLDRYEQLALGGRMRGGVRS